MDSSKKKSGALVGVALGLCIVLFIIFGFLIASKGVFDGGKFSTKLFKAAAILCAFAFSFYLQCIIHEFGHFVCGLMSGYKFSSFRVSNLVLIKTEEGLRFRRLSIAGTAGQCLMIPPKMQDGKFKFVLYNLGGVLMNLVSAAIALGITLVLNNTVAKVLLLCISIAGTALAIMNGVPYMTQTVSNDGNNLILMNKDEDSKKAFYMQLLINDKQLRGERLKDMPDDWFEIPESADRTNAIITVIDVFKENRLMDMHEFDKAYEMIEGFTDESSIQGMYRACLSLDKAYIEVLRNGKAADIDFLDKPDVKPIIAQMGKMPNTLRTNYAIELVKNDNKAAATKVKSAFDEICKHYPYIADVILEQELVALAKDKASENAPLA